jgi:hypothetical protein
MPGYAQEQLPHILDVLGNYPPKPPVIRLVETLLGAVI